MRKNVFGRKFKRDKNERKALFKSLIRSLILDGQIQTTLEKAKAIKGDIDKIVNKAKKGDKEAQFFLQPVLSIDAIRKLTKDIAPSVSDRNSGYTKLTKLGRRFSDNAPMVLMEWVGKEVKSEKLKGKSRDEKTATTETQKKDETQRQKLGVEK